MTVTILQGDCREVLRTLPDNSVHCVVTSPPYWGLRDYGVAGQIGLEQSVQQWVGELVAVFREVRRVLRSDGTLWLNLGDSYATGTTSDRSPTATGKHGYWEYPAVNKRIDGREIGLKPKDLIGQPWRVAFALQADGWWLRQEIIWAKVNPMPESVRDRCTKAHEQIFLLAKSGRYYFDADAIKEPCSPNTHARYATAKGEPFGMTNWGRGDEPRKPVELSAQRNVGIGRNAPPRKAVPNVGQREGPPGNPSPARKLAAAGSGTKNNDSMDAALAAMPTHRNKRSVWTVGTEPFSEAHFAMYPPSLIKPCIEAGCPVGGTVLDPFFGAGTTGLVADRLHRNCIGIELNPAYVEIARHRIESDAPLFAEVA